MALPYTNSVPLGREGTGAATILGPSRALQYWLGVSDRDRERLLAQQRAYQATQQSYNQQFAKDINQTLADTASPLWASDFNRLGGELFAYGGQLRSQGINPYTNNLNPENQGRLQTFRGGVNQLLNWKAQADDVRKEQQSILQDIMKNPANYRQEDIDAVRNIDRNISFQDFVQGNYELPQVQPKINFQEEGADTRFTATTTQPVEVELPDGVIRTETRTRINEDVANAYIDNAFTQGTPYAREVEARMRERGIDGGYGQLLGTTDEDQIRTYIDSYLKSTDESNPMLDLIADGTVPTIGTPEYEEFLDDAVREQLAAEMVLDEAKRQFYTGLQSNVRESDKISYSAVRANNRRAQQRFNTSQVKAGLDIKKTMLELSGQEEQPDDTYDLTIRSEVNDSEYVLGGAKSGSTTQFNFNISPEAYNTTLDQPVEGPSQARGSLIGTGVIAVNKETGRPMRGSYEDYIGDPNVEFQIKGQILTNDGDSFLENPEVIAQTLAGESKKFAQSSVANAKKYLKEVKKQHKDRLEGNSSSNKEQIVW